MYVRLALFALMPDEKAWCINENWFVFCGELRVELKTTKKEAFARDTTQNLLLHAGYI